MFLLLNIRAEGCSTQSMTSSCVQPSEGRWQQTCWREASTCLTSAPVPLRRLDSLKKNGSMGLTRSCGASWPASIFVWQLWRRCWSLIVDRLLWTPSEIREAQSDTGAARLEQSSRISDASYVRVWSEAKMLKVNWKHLNQRAEISRIWTEKSQSLIKSKTSYSCLVLTGLKSTMRLRADLSEQDNFSHVFIME